MSEDDTMNVYEVKTHLSRLCARAAEGSDVVIARHGQPWVRITTLEQPKPKIRFGVLKGKVTLAEDFDAPLSEELLRAIEGS